MAKTSIRRPVGDGAAESARTGAASFMGVVLALFRRRQHRLLVGAAVEFGDRASLAQDDDPVAQANELRHLARGDENAEPAVGERADAGVDLALGADVDAARRLVEQQEARLPKDLLGEDDLLLV